MALVAQNRISTRDKDGSLTVFEAGEAVTGISKAEAEKLLKDGVLKKGVVEKENEEKGE
jgi:hypothetical protein